MSELNDEQLQLRQQLEQRFCHTDREHPAIRVLFELQLNRLNTEQLES